MHPRRLKLPRGFDASTDAALTRQGFLPYDDPEMFYDPFYADSEFDVERIMAIMRSYKKEPGKRCLMLRVEEDDI